MTPERNRTIGSQPPRLCRSGQHRGRRPTAARCDAGGLPLSALWPTPTPANWSPANLALLKAARMSCCGGGARVRNHAWRTARVGRKGQFGQGSDAPPCLAPLGD